MSKRKALRHFWENIIGSVFALLGLLLLALVFLLGRFVDMSMIGLPASHPIPEDITPAEEPEVLPEPNVSASPVMPVDAQYTETDHKLPTSGVYAIDGASLDLTMNNIDFEIKEKQRLEQERLRRIAEAKRREELRRQEEARRKAEAKRQAEEAAKRAAEAKRIEAEKRKAEEQRKIEQAKQEAERKKAEEQRRAEEAKQKAAAEAERKKAEEAKRKAKAEAAEKKKAEQEAAKKKAAEEAAAKKKAEAEAKAKAEAEAKAKAEAERKAREAREAEAKLASLNVGTPSLDGLQSAVPGYGQGDVDAYSATLFSVVKRYYSVPANIPSNLSAKFVIKINAQGKVTDVKLSKSSGYPLFDSSARNAIMSASPLPLPSNSALRDAAIKDGILFNFTL